MNRSQFAQRESKGQTLLQSILSPAIPLYRTSFKNLLAANPDGVLAEIFIARLRANLPTFITLSLRLSAALAAFSLAFLLRDLGDLELDVF